MNDRERLIEILYNGVYVSPENELKGTVQKLADYLIANGVAIQERGVWFTYRCPKCNSSAADYSETKKPRFIKCSNCGVKMDLESEQ